MPEKRALPNPLHSVGESSIEQHQHHDEKKLKLEDPCNGTAHGSISSNDSKVSCNPCASIPTQNHHQQLQLQGCEITQSQTRSMARVPTVQQGSGGVVASGIPKAEDTSGIISNLENQASEAVGNKKDSDSTLTSSDSSSGRKDNTVSSAPLHSSHFGMIASVKSETPDDTVDHSTRQSDLASMHPPSTVSETTGMGSKKESPIPPLKSTKMRHLLKKYMPQLEYMHREFKKLERQLLGAKSSAKGLTESAGSRERREKLHSFIVHLEETMNQIHVGCELEQGGKKSLDGNDVSITSVSGNVSAQASIQSSETDASQHASESVQAHAQSLGEEESKREFARSAALTKLTKEKEQEENVQKLEEHILANLLPVKERLTKQLAAQQGAVKNPIGMPVRRGLQTQIPTGRETAATESCGSEVSRPVSLPPPGPVMGHNALSQFGKPLQGGGSSLTQKLHGKTLGSQKYVQGQQVTAEKGAIGVPSTTRKVMYAGMTPGSGQVQSGVSAATGVHNMVIESSRHRLAIAETSAKDAKSATPPPPPPPPIVKTGNDLSVRPPNSQRRAQHAAQPENVDISSRTQSMTATLGNANKCRQVVYVTITSQSGAKDSKEEQNREKIKKNSIHQVELQRSAVESQNQQMPYQPETRSMPKKVVKSSLGHRVCSNPRKGPRSVEYICALCNETYKSTCEYNPWWALSSHECAKCGKTQIPRLDISSPANAIDYHPALLVHANIDESGKGSSKTVSVSSVPKQCIRKSEEVIEQDTDNEGSVIDDIEDKDSFDSDSEDLAVEENTPIVQAQNEDFGKKYSGPKFNDYDASRLLILMGHASTCPGRHQCEKHRECCANVKFMMLHVRDCPGTTPSNDICPFPWCRKTKHLLYHLLSCPSSSKCKICTPVDLSRNLTALKGLNEYRSKNSQEVHPGKQTLSNIPNKAADTNSPTQDNDFSRGIRKVAPQRRPSRIGVATSAARAMMRNSQVHQQRPSVISLPRSKDTGKLSVPSPIPTAGLSSSKPNNPLSQGQSQTLTGKVNHPASKPKTPYLSSKSNLRKDLVTTKRPPSQGIGNPLSMLNPPASYIAPNISSPPNPLKGLPSEHLATPGTNFPTLPTQISINDDGGNTTSKDCLNLMRKVKIESDR